MYSIIGLYTRVTHINAFVDGFLGYEMYLYTISKPKLHESWVLFSAYNKYSYSKSKEARRYCVNSEIIIIERGITIWMWEFVELNSLICSLPSILDIHFFIPASSIHFLIQLHFSTFSVSVGWLPLS